MCQKSVALSEPVSVYLPYQYLPTAKNPMRYSAKGSSRFNCMLYAEFLTSCKLEREEHLLLLELEV